MEKSLTRHLQAMAASHLGYMLDALGPPCLSRIVRPKRAQRTKRKSPTGLRHTSPGLARSSCLAEARWILHTRASIPPLSRPQIVRRLEMNATFPHVELLPRRLLLDTIGQIQ